MPVQLTEKQQAFFEFIQRYVNRHARWPRYTVIMEHFSYRSKNSVAQNLRALAAAGYIHRGAEGWEILRWTVPVDAPALRLKQIRRITTRLLEREALPSRADLKRLHSLATWT